MSAATVARGRSRAGVGLSGRETMLLLIPALSTFQDMHPDIQLDPGVIDRVVDRVAERVDCVIRFR